MVQAVAHFAKNNPRQLAILKARVECFQTRQFVDYRLGHTCRFALGHDRDIVRDEAAQALPVEATQEITHGFNVGLGFLGALLGGTIGKQEQRTDHFVAPLQAIDEVELQLGKILCRVHACSPLLTSALPLPPRAMHASVLPR